jgi:hypothetical protein
MSDPFDPEAWPRSTGASSPRDDDEDENFTTSEDDGFNPFAGSENGEDDNYDASTFGTAAGEYGEEDPYGAYGTEETEQEDDFQGSYGDDDFSYDQAAGVGAGAAAAGAGAAAASGRGRGTDDDYRDEFDDYDDFDDYDEDDNYQDDFDDNFDDREPNDGSNTRRILAIVGAILAVGLIGGGLLYAFGGDGNKPTASPTTTQTSAPAGNTDTTQTTDTTAPTQSTGTTEPATQQAQAPADVTETLNSALAAWGRFAVNGNLEEVKPYFVEDSNQYNRFKLDAAAIASQPPGGAPINVTMPNPQTFNDGDNDNRWLIRGTATWVRPGEREQNFNWEITMTRASDRQPWLIQSVRQF